MLIEMSATCTKSASRAEMSATATKSASRVEMSATGTKSASRVELSKQDWFLVDLTSTIFHIKLNNMLAKASPLTTDVV